MDVSSGGSQEIFENVIWQEFLRGKGERLNFVELEAFGTNSGLFYGDGEKETRENKRALQGLEWVWDFSNEILAR